LTGWIGHTQVCQVCSVDWIWWGCVESVRCFDGGAPGVRALKRASPSRRVAGYDAVVTDDAQAWFHAVLDAAAPAAAAALRDDPELAQGLVAAWRSAAAGWTASPVPTARFAAYVGARLPADGDADAIGRVVVGDLWLACASVDDLPGAHAILRERHLVDVKRGLGRQADATTIDELVHEVWQRMLVGDGERPPRLADYSGRGSLGRWISVVARRVALDRARTTGRVIDPIDDDGAGMAAAYGDPELAAMKRGTRDAFRIALEQAAAALQPRDRNMLRYAFVHQLGVDEIAGIYRVSRSTARRQLAAIREALVAAVRERLRVMLRVDAAELERELAQMHSAVAVTLSRILRPPR
jgi:RNA polymerase sigma-70 factor (ECF subfamily)